MELLEERAPDTVSEVMDILRDHTTRPEAICKHPDPAGGEEADSVLLSMVVEVETRPMWVAPGNPGERDFEEIDLWDLRGP